MTTYEFVLGHSAAERRSQMDDGNVNVHATLFGGRRGEARDRRCAAAGRMAATRRALLASRLCRIRRARSLIEMSASALG
jgi:hypothetical protein